MTAITEEVCLQNIAARSRHGRGRPFASKTHDAVHGVQAFLWLGYRMVAMRYYASFFVDDEEREDSRYFRGVPVLKPPLAETAGPIDIKAILASGLDVEKNDRQIVCWSALH